MVTKIHCAHILVEKQSVAQEIKAKIAAGESFSKLAQQYSIDVSKKRGGDLGLFGRGVMVTIDFTPCLCTHSTSEGVVGIPLPASLLSMSQPKFVGFFATLP